VRNILYLVVLALAGVAAPDVYAFEPDRDWAPSDPCGSIDPDRACYLPLGTRDCPQNTSKSNCLARCDCQYETTRSSVTGGEPAFCSPPKK
jgi:hypothetical protein